ncbi:hypothetical protein AB0K04_07650 [Micromonospora coxensis]|uniref:leucine-rich repeat domain-containing protein n=1 Tax=Micromonospora coxensis TaxID=356852 RepID=UPI003432E863
MLIYLESPDGPERLFWEARPDGATLTVRSGPVGAAGDETTTTHDSAQAAADTGARLADERRAAGYHDVACPYRGLDVDLTHGAGGNRFAALLAESVLQIHHLELFGCLANAVMGTSDAGGNPWHEHVSPVDGRTYVFCVDHETGDIFGEVYPAAVFDVVCDGEDLHEEYVDDPGPLAEVFAAEAPDVVGEPMKRVTQLAEDLWARADWLTRATYGQAGSAPYLPGDLTAELAHPDFADMPGYALYWLWRAYLTGDDGTVRRLLPLAAGSRLRLVRDAATVVGGLLGGDRTVGSLDAHARRVEVCRMLTDQRRAAAKDRADRQRPADEVARENARIRALDHRDAGLTGLPRSVAEYRGLTSWDLSGNALTELVDEFAALTELRELDLTGNRFTRFPAVLTRLPRLARLRHTYCGTTSVPDEVGGMSELVELDLSGNRLETLPSAIGGLPHLRELRLADCGLSTLPAELGQLTGLRHLDLHSNDLTALPEGFAALTGLESLDLSYQYRLALPALFDLLARLPRLRELRLSVVAAQVPQRLADVPALRTLRLSVDHAETLQALLPLLARQPALRELDLVGGQLTALPAGLADLTGLEAVHIRRPRHPGTLAGAFVLDPRQALAVLGGLPHLRRLTLDLDRGIGDLPEQITTLTGLTDLDLRGSSFRVGALPPGLRRLDLTRTLGWQDEEPDLTGCPDLAELRMAGIRSRTLPRGLGPALRVLDATEHHFSAAAPDLTACPHLRELHLGTTALAELPAGLDAMTELEHLDLTNARFTDAQAAVARLGALANLTTLNLSGLHLTTLSDELAAAARLTEVNLSRNPKMRWKKVAAVLGRLSALTTLRLTGCGLRELPPPLAALTGLRVLDLRGNPLSAQEYRRIRRLMPQTLVHH